MTFPERVKAFLWSIIHKMSECPGQFAKNPHTDFKRKRKLDFENLMRFLISMEMGSTGHELLKYFEYNLNVLSSSAFYQQRKKLLVQAFQHLLFQFNSQFPFIKFRGEYQLAACDGSEFNIARNPDDPDTFHPPSGASTRGFNMIHTISLYDILNKKYLDCEIQPGRKKNEFRALCALIDRYQYENNTIFIADRGFASYNVFAHAFEKGTFFLIRAKDINAQRLLHLQTLPAYLDATAEIVLTRTTSKKKRKHPELDNKYRYISPEVAFDYIKHGALNEYPMALRIVRFEIAEGICENIITNLPADEFPAHIIKELYHMRWDIETSFRDLKHTIGAVNFHSKKVEYIEQEIWARLILFNFCTTIISQVLIVRKDTKHTYQVNFAMAIKVCHYFIRLKNNKSPPDVEGLISSYLLPIRLGRSYAHQHRFQLPVSFCYRF